SSLKATWSPGATVEGQAYSLVYHYDKERDADVEARTVIARDWRYTEWDGGRTARELYLRTGDASEYRNVAADARTRNLTEAGADLLRRHPQPKPGPANRPR